MKKKQNSEILVYQSKTGAISLRADAKFDSVWATQAQIAEVFAVDRSVVTKHIRNIFNDGEVKEKSNVQKMHIANSDKPVSLYSLDIILSVGYRTNSAKAIDFRQWATKTLRQHITDGYTIDKKRVSQNYEAFMLAVEKVQAVLPAAENLDTKQVLNLITLFADTWFSLDAYDKEAFSVRKINKKQIKLTAGELSENLRILREELSVRGEANDNFAQERNRDSLEGIVGNVLQSFSGKELYPSVEEKAAHLIYFIIKNHPFVDGNKRSGAYAFVWFLQKARVLDVNKLTPTALTALTLLIAESAPSDKEKVVGLVVLLLSKK